MLDIKVTHQQLWDFEQKECQKNENNSGAMEPVGLLLHRNPLLGEYPGPPNGAQFGYTGGDFTSFSYLDVGDPSFGGSPVILTIPPLVHGHHIDAIVGENLHEFLSLGCQAGFFFMDLYPDQSFYDLYCNPDGDWLNEEEEEEEDRSERKRLLAVLINEFSLAPWRNIEKRLEQLQKEYGHLVQEVTWWT